MEKAKIHAQRKWESTEEVAVASTVEVTGVSTPDGHHILALPVEACGLIELHAQGRLDGNPRPGTLIPAIRRPDGTSYILLVQCQDFEDVCIAAHIWLLHELLGLLSEKDWRQRTHPVRLVRLQKLEGI